jgi:exodeoxyribonuclease VII large subunit
MPIRSPYGSLNNPGQAFPVLRVYEAIGVCNELFSGLSMSVEGEVANYSLSRGKFVFFDLKDEKEDARLSCFMMVHQLSAPLEDGMRIVVHARPGLYQKNGQFRLSVSGVEFKGEGSVKRAFELLKSKLEAEGLFAAGRKRLLPRYVERVAIISSEDAAGFGDFCTIAFARLPGVQFCLANVAVQGKDAESEICAAFDYVNGHTDTDVIVLIRGGGSMEDLHAFNGEPVARAIVRSKVPVLVGVGHERDVTIADFCADVRASTPSNAAQILLPTRDEVREYVEKLTVSGRIQVERTIQLTRERTVHRVERLDQHMRTALESYRIAVRNRLKSIEGLSPESTLKRGYTLTRTSSGELLTSSHGAKPGTKLVTQFMDGRLESTT